MYHVNAAGSQTKSFPGKDGLAARTPHDSAAPAVAGTPVAGTELYNYEAPDEYRLPYNDPSIPYS